MPTVLVGLRSRSAYIIIKAANEAIVEGMCKTVGRQANSTRGLTFGRCALRFFMLCADVDACDVIECDVVAYAAFSSRAAIDAHAHDQLAPFDAHAAAIL